MLRFAVRDTGPGRAADAIERIFAEFEQAEQGPARRHGGTGLGLAISKRLVDEMGGRISVASVPGAGATFTVDLPFAVPAAGRRPSARLAEAGRRARRCCSCSTARSKRA